MPDSTPDSVADLSPVLRTDPLDIRLSLTNLVHWADNHDHRVNRMREVGFPGNDMLAFLVVNQLTYRGALRPTDLASMLGTTKPNMSKVVRKLEDAGLAVRAASPFDDRSVLVALTAQGRAIGERIIASASRWLDNVLVDWSDDDIQTLRRLLALFTREARYEIALRSPAIGIQGADSTVDLSPRTL